MRMKRFRGEGWALLGMIWALAWPTMLEQLMSTAVQYVDAAMVGRLGATVLRMVAVSEPFFGVAIILEGMLQGTGNTMAPFVFNIIGMWGVRILGTFVCTRLLHMGLVAAWACMIAHNLLLFLLLLTYCLRGRWNPLTRG